MFNNVRNQAKCFLYKVFAIIVAFVSVLSIVPFSGYAVYASTRARDIYVSSTGENAHFSSVQEAIYAASAGSTIVVRDGIYEEGSINVSKSGTRDRKIVIKADGNNAVIIGNFVIDGSYVRLEGLKMDGQEKNTKAAILINKPYCEVVKMDIRSYLECAVIFKDIRLGEGGSNAYAGYNYIYNCAAGFEVTSDTIIEHNEVERMRSFNIKNFYKGDFLRPFGKNIIIRNNYVHGTLKEEMYVDGYGYIHTDMIQTWDEVRIDITNILIENNVFLGFYHQGLMLENDTYGAGGTFYIRDWTVRNNVFAGYTSWGICGGKINGGIPNLNVYNNIFAAAGTEGYYGVMFVGIGGSGIVKNNIIVGHKTSSYGASNGAVMDGDYNLIYNGPAPSVVGDYDIVGMDPKFVDFDPSLDLEYLAKSDFSLASDSPAIDSGTDVDVKFDIENNPRKQGEHTDIGPYEFSGTPVNIPPKVFLLGLSDGQVVEEGTIIPITVDAKDRDGIEKIDIYRDGEKLEELFEEPYQFNIPVKKGVSRIMAKAYDKTGLSTESRTASIIVSNDAHIRAEQSWKNNSMGEKKRQFAVEFSIVPLGDLIDACVLLSENPLPYAGYGSSAVGFRFYTNGKVESRSGALYKSEYDITYKAGILYHFRIEVDIQNKTHNMYITPEGEPTRKFAADYDFRAQPNSIKNWCVVAEAGEFILLGFTDEVPLTIDYKPPFKETIELTIDNHMMKVNGEAREIEQGSKISPTIHDGYAMVPIRAIIEELGGTVEWVEQMQTVIINYNKNLLSLTIGSQKAFLNGKEIEMEVSPLVSDGRTMFPIRFISETIGCKVTWDEDTQTVIIEK